MPHVSPRLRLALLLLWASWEASWGAACGGSGGPKTSSGEHHVGGTLSGVLGGGLVLQNNARDPLLVPSDGTFAFASPLAEGATYQVTIAKQPASPAQLCTVRNASGTVPAADVTSVVVTCHPLPRCALVADPEDKSLSSYAIEGESGRLSFVGRVPAGGGPVAVVATPDGRYAYAASPADSALLQFGVAADCLLSAMTPASVIAGGAPRGLALDPTGRFVHAMLGDGTLSVFTIGDHGLLAPLSIPAAEAGVDPRGLAFEPSGRFLYVASGASSGPGGGVIWQFRLVDGGALVPLVPPSIEVSGVLRALAVEPGGRFLYVGKSGGNGGGGSGNGAVLGFAIGPDGTLTPLAPSSFSTGGTPSALAVAAAGDRLFVTDEEAGTLAQLRIARDGSLTSTGAATLPTEAGPRAIAPDPSGRFVYVAGERGGGVSQFLDDGNGALAPQSPRRVAAQGAPAALTLVTGAAFVSTAAHFVFALGFGDGDNAPGNVVSFGVGAEGQLTRLSMLGLGAMGPVAMAVDSSAKHAYVAGYADDTLAAFSLDDKGVLAPSSPPSIAVGKLPVQVVLHPAGRLVYVASQIDRTIAGYPVNADGSLVPTPATMISTQSAGPVSSMLIEPSGRFLFATLSGNQIAGFALGRAGALSPLSPPIVTIGMTPGSLAVAPSGRFLYAADGEGNAIVQLAIGLGGELTPLSPPSAPAGKLPSKVAMDPAGRYFYATNLNDRSVSQYALSATGLATPLSPAELSFGATATDQPGSLVVAQGDEDGDRGKGQGTFAYLLNQATAGGIWSFAVGADGTLAPLGSTMAPTGASPTALVAVGLRR